MVSKNIEKNEVNSIDENENNSETKKVNHDTNNINKNRKWLNSFSCRYKIFKSIYSF